MYIICSVEEESARLTPGPTDLIAYDDVQYLQSRRCLGDVYDIESSCPDGKSLEKTIKHSLLKVGKDSVRPRM